MWVGAAQAAASVARRSGSARMLLGGGRGREHDPAAGTLRPPRRDPPARPLRPDLPARRLPPHAATASSTLGRRLPSPCCDSDLRPTPTTPLCDGGHSPAPKGRADCRWAEEYTGRRAPSQPEMGGGCRGGSSRELRRSRRWAQRPDWEALQAVARNPGDPPSSWCCTTSSGLNWPPARLQRPRPRHQFPTEETS
jgi:hypothetical protein